LPFAQLLLFLTQNIWIEKGLYCSRTA